MNRVVFGCAIALAVSFHAQIASASFEYRFNQSNVLGRTVFSDFNRSESNVEVPLGFDLHPNPAGLSFFESANYGWFVGDFGSFSWFKQQHDRHTEWTLRITGQSSFPGSEFFNGALRNGNGNNGNGNGNRTGNGEEGIDGDDGTISPNPAPAGLLLAGSGVIALGLGGVVQRLRRRSATKQI